VGYRKVPLKQDLANHRANLAGGTDHTDAEAALSLVPRGHRPVPP
jgi:hypothetical protein